MSLKKTITPIHALLPGFTLKQQAPPHSRLPLITYLIKNKKKKQKQTEMGSFHFQQTNEKRFKYNYLFDFVFLAANLRPLKPMQ